MEILVANDTKMVLKIIEKALSENDELEVYTANDGLKAFEMLERKNKTIDKKDVEAVEGIKYMFVEKVAVISSNNRNYKSR